MDDREPPRERKLGILLVDHGSRRPQSNQQLVELARGLFGCLEQSSSVAVVCAAHMEIAEPGIADGFAECVRAGASRIVVVPCFLARGRHVEEDIPELLASAAALHPQVSYAVLPPLSEHEGFLELLRDAALHHAQALA